MTAVTTRADLIGEAQKRFERISVRCAEQRRFGFDAGLELDAAPVSVNSLLGASFTANLQAN